LKRSELRTKVITNTGRSDKTTVINDGLDFGLRNLSQTHPFLALRTGEIDVSVVTNDLSVQLPGTIRQIVELRLIDTASPTQSFPLKLIRKREFVERFPNVGGSSITGTPSYCYFDSPMLWFNVSCNSSYTVRLTRFSLDKFDSDFDETVIPDADEILIAYATAYTYESVQMYTDAQYWFNKFRALVMLAVENEERQIGVRLVHSPYCEKPDIVSNSPWLDPFAGHSGDSR
jgi:hypothetical protein